MSTASYDALILAEPSLYAYWKLQEASGTSFADSGPNAYNGTLSGTVAGYHAPSMFGDALDVSLHLDTSGAISLPTGANPLTMECWVRFHGFPASGATAGIMQSGYNGGLVFGGWGSATAMGFDVYIGGFITCAVNPTTHFGDFKRHQIVEVYDGAHILVYVDGALVASQAATGTLTYDGLDHYINHYAVGAGAGDGYDMDIERVSWYSAPLSGADVLAHYNAAVDNGAPVVTIGGTQVPAIAGTLNAQQQIGQRGQGSLSVWSALGTMWPYGTAISITDRFGAPIYSGYVTDDGAYKSGARLGTGLLQHDLTLMDNAYRADKRLIIQSFLRENAGDIFADLATNALGGEGVTISGTVGSGSVATGVLITEKAFVLAKVSEAFDWLAEQCGYWWMIDAAGVAWFQPYGGLAASGSLDGTTISADDKLKVKRGNALYVNRQYVRGGYDKTPQRTEYLPGDGHKRAFTLAYEVADMISVYENSVLKSTGTKGVDSGKDVYFAVGDAVIAQDDSGTTLGSGDTLVVTYKGRYPVIGVATNPTLIAQQAVLEGGGTGIVESAATASQVYDQATATQQASALLAKYGSDLITLDYYTLTPGTLLPGQSISVSLSDFALSNHSMLVTALEITDGVDSINLWYHYTLVGSPYSAAQWENFYKRALAQTPDPAAFGNLQTVVVVAGAMQSNSGLSVTAAQVVAPAGSDVLQANAALQGP